MCDACQWEFGNDHDLKGGHGRVPCPKCGRFFVERGQRRCYHCFAVGLDECERCRRGEVRSVPLQ